MSCLSEPLRLPCGVILHNRLAKAAMTEGLGDPLNRATQQHVNLYRRWSQGGAGLLLTGNVLVDRTHLERIGNIAIDDNDGLAMLRQMAQAGTSGGNQLWLQINHPGRQTPIHLNPQPLAPSALPIPGREAYFGHPRAMTEAQIEDVIRRFAFVAEVARDTGFTGVQIHAAHGYLVSQFLSPLANRRRDAWGGSLENRCRLLLEIIRATRNAVGADFPLSVKLNSADFQRGGFTEDESIKVAAWLGQAAVDLLEISGGNYEAPQMMGRSNEQLDEDARAGLANSTRLREAYFLEYARKLRSVIGIPLMITGGFRSRALMENALQRKELDVIGLARPLCISPELCRGLLDGSIEQAPRLEGVFLERSRAPAEMDEQTFRIFESGAQIACASMQLLRMGAGEEPDPTMDLLEAFNAHQQDEQQRFAVWCKP